MIEEGHKVKRIYRKNTKKAKREGNYKKQSHYKWTTQLFIDHIIIPLLEGKTLQVVADHLRLSRQGVLLQMKKYNINNKKEAMMFFIQTAKEGKNIKEALDERLLEAQQKDLI